MKKAFKVIAHVTDKSWLHRGTTVTAENAQAAQEKAYKILSLTTEHTIEVVPVTVYSPGTELTTDSYPYGRQRTTAKFLVEVNNKGYRAIFQTVNPKTGQWNKPKAGTYSCMILPYKNEVNGHYEFCGHTDFNGTEEINRGLHFIADFYELFTPDQIKDLALSVISGMRTNAVALKVYAGINWEELKPLVTEQVQIAANIAKTAENRFLECVLPHDKIEALKPENYNPFTVTTHSINS